MNRSHLMSRVRLFGAARRRPTLEVHVPISPTPAFLYQLRCLTHSLRHFGGAYRNAPVIVTVGGDPVDEGLAARMPWLDANGIELRWVPAEQFGRLGIFATGMARLRQDFRSDVVLLLDADTVIRRPLDGLIEQVYRDRVLAGVIAHTTPLVDGRLHQPDWAQLFSLCGLDEPFLTYEHTGWGYFFADPRYRYCPAYFNYGVIAAPADFVRRISSVSEWHLLRLRHVMGSYFDAQLALTMSIAQLGVPVLPLPMRFNMTNNPWIEALYHTEVEHSVILHYLAEQHFRREETFASLSSLEAFLARKDLRVTSKMVQEVIREVFPYLATEERAVGIAV